MTYQFSFSNKNELIYIDNQPCIDKIGSLLKCLIDTDWASLLDTVDCANHDFADIKYKIKRSLKHPVAAFAVEQCATKKELISLLEKNMQGNLTALMILETLVDEEQSAYEEMLLRIVSDHENRKFDCFFDSLGNATILSFRERNRVQYHNTNDFPFLFETNDLLSIVFQELEYICLNRFFIRKCTHCKRFMWTKKMNQVYCDRTVADTKKTCAQVGPATVWRNNNSKAYALYWTYRTRLFNRVDDEQNNYCYHRWLKETEDLRNKAKNNMIHIDDMRSALDHIECEIYQKAACL